MHNIHFVVVNAVDEDDAVSKVEYELDNFGGEDNWYNINSVHNLEELQEGSREHKIVLDHLSDLNKEVNQVEKVKAEISSLLTRQSEENRHVYYMLSDAYRRLYEMSGVTPNYTIENIIKGECQDYNSYQYDEYGITDLYDEEDDTQTYFVVVDMHS